jgi:hypothetical protein
MSTKTIMEIKNDPHLIAYCGLYCAACGKFTSGKCPGCKQLASPHWCKIRTCCMDQNFMSCAQCDLPTPNDCKTFNNPISKVFKFIFRSDREKCIMTIREKGEVYYAANMARTRRQAIKVGEKE